MDEALRIKSGEASWAGDGSPFAVSWQKLMMWIFIVSDALLFAGLLTGYGVVRLVNGTWPDQSEVFNLQFIALMTFILISSSATMAIAVAAAKHGDHRMVTFGLLLTIIGGFSFLGCQAYEWTELIHEGATLYANPWGVPLFGASFFVITGFHGTHVLTGVIVLLVVLFRSLRGLTTAEGVEIAGLYWHFVDLVWVFVFTLFYLV